MARWKKSEEPDKRRAGRENEAKEKKIRRGS